MEDRCPHGNIVGEQGGVAQSDIDSCDGNEELLDGLLAFYAACDCCGLLMHHSAPYQLLADGRTLCSACPDAALDAAGEKHDADG